MLTETVSDPRRANWLTITSMSEDLCWPDEPAATRPSWELEAEILRLTTRLMMRERELRQAKNQLKSQAARTQQQATSWRQRMEEKEDQMREVLLQKDAEMQNIVSQLLLFEAELRREQSRIEDLLTEKEEQIQTQRKEIERLRHRTPVGAKTSTNSEDSGVVIPSSDWSIPRSRHKNSIGAKTSNNSEDSGVVIPSSDWSIPGSRQKNSIGAKTSNNSEDSGVEIPSSDWSVQGSRHSVGANNSTNSKDRGAVMSSSDWSIQGSRQKNSIGAKTSINSEDSGVVMSSSDSCPSPSDASDVRDEYRHDRDFDSRQDDLKIMSDCFEGYRDRVFEDMPSVYDSQQAVQKLKDGLGKIRAIQDVTNVKPLEFSYDCVMPDKKRIPYRAPQKMKDLKAKRNVNPHRIHRSGASEMNNQVIL